MAQFITRVELHGVYHDDNSYQTLHEFMGKAGFKRTIKASDGLLYHLLTAEYSIEGYLTIDKVLQAASLAASLTTKKHSVFVSEIKQASWEGLKVV
jgi:hypothetical protein